MWPLQTRDCLRTWPVAPCLWPHTAKMEKKQRRQDKEWQMWTRAALSNEGKQRSTPQTLWKGDIGGIQCSLHIVDILWSLPNDMSFVVSLWILTICRMLLSVISLRWLSSNELVAFIAIIETGVWESHSVCACSLFTAAVHHYVSLCEEETQTYNNNCQCSSKRSGWMDL